MGKIEQLASAYERQANHPWERGISGQEKIWFAVYQPENERRLRYRMQEFETATMQAQHRWMLCDITDAFAEWMGQQKYRDSYFEEPEDLELKLRDFREFLANRIRAILHSADANTVVGIFGIAALFGFMKVSELMEAVAPAIPGRLLVFFPGEHEGTNYRLLDARDGWNYLAVSITV